MKMGGDTDRRRSNIDATLTRFDLDFDLRTSSDDEVCYEVRVPLTLPTEAISDAILKLNPDGHAAVEWSEKKVKG